MFYPLKIFKINLDDIYLIISLSINMIPILKKEMLNLKEAFLAKGIRLSFKNIAYFFIIFFTNLLKKVNLIEEAITTKGVIIK